MITITGLIKRFGNRVAVDDLTVAVEPGRVTGFLGPNGSGKSTTMRCMLQLDRPDAGEVLFAGRRFRDLNRPLTHVGALLDAAYVHPGRRAKDHLLAYAVSNGLPKSRIGEVLGMVGLAEMAKHRVGTFSLGMKQRLGIAATLLGDPQTLILDEPANGLDPEGIRWIRDFLAFLAGQGRTVFVSSHLLSEMSLMADHLVVIGNGRLIQEGSVQSFVDRYADHWVRVRTPHAQRLVGAVGPAGGVVAEQADGAFEVRGLAAEQVGEIGAAAGVVFHELSPQQGSLEDAFLEATKDAQEFRGGSHTMSPPVPAMGGTLPPPVVPSNGGNPE